MKINIPKLHCERCGWNWAPRNEEVRLCPRCKSAYWDIPRLKGRTPKWANLNQPIPPIQEEKDK